MDLAKVAASIERVCDQERDVIARAQRIAATKPALSHYLQNKAWTRLGLAEELLRRLPNMEPDLLNKLAERAQKEEQEKELLTALSTTELVRRYLQDLWREPELVKVANAEGLDLHRLADLLCSPER
jgi:hypothetical protein